MTATTVHKDRLNFRSQVQAFLVPAKQGTRVAAWAGMAPSVITQHLVRPLCLAVHAN